MSSEQKKILSKKEAPLNYCDTVDTAKCNQRFKNKFENYNSWCLDHSVIKENLDYESQAVNKEKAIDFQCSFCLKIAVNPTECF